MLNGFSQGLSRGTRGTLGPREPNSDLTGFPQPSLAFQVRDHVPEQKAFRPFHSIWHAYMCVHAHLPYKSYQISPSVISRGYRGYISVLIPQFARG
jgi:hypothetical protein